MFLTNSRSQSMLARAITSLLTLSTSAAFAQDVNGPLYVWERNHLNAPARSVVREAADGSFRVHTTFDPNGRTYRERTVMSSGTETADYTWDPEARVLTTVRRSSVVGDSTWSDTYDAQGRPVSSMLELLYRGGYSATRYTYQHDGNEQRTFREGELTTVTITTVHSDGTRTVESTRVADGTRSVFHEVERNRAIEAIHYDARGAIASATRFEYAYDVRGNWIRQVRYPWVPALGRYSENGEVRTREIDYY